MWKAAVPGAALRRTVNRFAPGPLIVTFLSINNSPLVRLIEVRPGAKLIVSPDVVVAIASRSVQLAPGQLPPESAELFTVKLAASTPGARSRAKMSPAKESRYRRCDFVMAKNGYGML
jgi:hypothetical protein